MSPLNSENVLYLFLSREWLGPSKQDGGFTIFLGIRACPMCPGIKNAQHITFKRKQYA